MKAKQCVLYARFSPRPNANDCDSIEKQIERLRAYCQARGWEIAAEYQDVAKSAKSLDGRRGLEAAADHAGRIRGILLVYDWSRLTRDVEDGGALLRRLVRRRATLASVADNVDLTTPTGRFTFNVLNAKNQLQREEGNLRTSKAMRHHQNVARRRMGRVDRVPFGMRADDAGGLEPDPDEQAAIARIVALNVPGVSARGICRQLDEEGISRRGKKWHPNGNRLVMSILARESSTPR